MESRGKISYYQLKHPFKEEETVVFNENKILEILDKFKEGMEIKRTLYVPKKNDEQKNRLLAQEKHLAKKYEATSERLSAWTILHFFTGLTLSYVFFQPLFRLGYLPLISFLTRQFKTVTPNIANTYADVGAQLVAPIAGLFLGFSPLIISAVVMYAELKHARKHAKHAEMIKDFNKLEFEIVESKDLFHFHKSGDDLIQKTREESKTLRKATNNQEKISVCRKMRSLFDKLIALSKLYKLDCANERYHEIQNSFYDLEHRLRNQRFWRNDQRFIMELLGDFD